jgi:hypothetical protein
MVLRCRTSPEGREITEDKVEVVVAVLYSSFVSTCTKKNFSSMSCSKARATSKSNESGLWKVHQLVSEIKAKAHPTRDRNGPMSSHMQMALL